MFNKLTQLIIRSFIGPFLVAFFITLFILVMQFVWRYIDDFMGKGLELSVILELVFYAGIAILPMSLPLAVLFASILTLGSLAEKSELTALKVAGLSLSQILRPLFFLCLFISGIAFLFSTYLLPIIRVKYYRILTDVAVTKPAFNIEEKIFYREIEGMVLRVNKKDPKDKTKIYDILIYDHNYNGGNKNLRTTLAKEGKMSVVNQKGEKKLRVELFDGHVYEENYGDINSQKTHPYKQYAFKKMEKSMDMPGFTMQKSDEENFKSDYSTENFFALGESIKNLKKDFEQIIKKSSTIWEKKLLYFNKEEIRNCYREVIDKKNSLIGIPIPFLCFDFNQISKENKEKVKEKTKETLNSLLDQVKYNFIDRSQRIEKNERYSSIEWHFRITFPLTCLVMFFIGAPMGAITKKGGLGLPILFSVLFFIIFYVTDSFAKNAAEDGEIQAFLGHWTAIFVLFPIGWGLLYMAKKELSFWNKSLWLRFFKRIFLLK